MLTPMEVGNQALALVGGARVAQFDDGSVEGEQLAAHYERVVGKALTSPGGAPFRWSFATRQEYLSQLDRTPTARWAYGYQQPPDLLRMHAVLQNGSPVEFYTQGTTVLSNRAGPLVAEYTARVDESAWPPDFLDGVVNELAAVLALALNENADLAKTLKAAIDWRGMRTADSQSHSSRRFPRATRLLGARLGGWGRGWGSVPDIYVPPTGPGPTPDPDPDPTLPPYAVLLGGVPVTVGGAVLTVTP